MVDDALNEIILPLFDSFVTVSIGDIEHNYAAVSTSVEGVAQTLKAFLTGCVPDLQWNNLTRSYLYLLLDKISADSWLVVEARLLVLI